MKKRWHKAQTYEKAFWQKTANKIISDEEGQLDWYDWRAGEFEKRTIKYSDAYDKKNSKILEIGSGPIGLINFLKWGKKYAIDPLEDFYKNNKVLIHLRNNNITYLNGKGENLPFEDKEFSIVIIDNVIDHTENPQIVLEEIYRVLKDNGLLFLTVNIHTPLGTMLRSIMELFQIDKGHPYTFSYKNICCFLKTNRFGIVSEDLEDYYQIKKKNCQSKNLKNKLKGYLGISEILYTCICLKN